MATLKLSCTSLQNDLNFHLVPHSNTMENKDSQGMDLTIDTDEEVFCKDLFRLSKRFYSIL